MRIAALLVVLFTIAVGVVGSVAPHTGMALRRLYYATPGRFYAAVRRGFVQFGSRDAMGVVNKMRIAWLLVS